MATQFDSPIHRIFLIWPTITRWGGLYPQQSKYADPQSPPLCSNNEVAPTWGDHVYGRLLPNNGVYVDDGCSGI